MPLFLPIPFVNVPIRPEHRTCLFVLAVIIVNDNNNISCFQSVFEQICCSKAEISCSNHAFIYFTLWNVHFKSTTHTMQWFVKLVTCLVLLASKKAQKGQKKCVVFLILYALQDDVLQKGNLFMENDCCKTNTTCTYLTHSIMTIWLISFCSW